MSDTLHPIVDIAIELLTPNEAGELVLLAESRNILVEVINDVPNQQLPKTIFALAEFSEMVRTRHHSPVGAEQLLKVAEIYIGQLEQCSTKTEGERRDALAKGNKFLGFSSPSRQRNGLMDSSPKPAINLRDLVQDWRGVIAC